MSFVSGVNDNYVTWCACHTCKSVFLYFGKWCPCKLNQYFLLTIRILLAGGFKPAARHVELCGPQKIFLLLHRRLKTASLGSFKCQTITLEWRLISIHSFRSIHSIILSCVVLKFYLHGTFCIDVLRTKMIAVFHIFCSFLFPIFAA